MFVDVPSQLNPKRVMQLTVNADDTNTVWYSVSASAEVSLFFIDDQGLENIRQKNLFNHFNKMKQGRYFEETVRLPHTGRFYLLIYNPSNQIIYLNHKLRLVYS